MTMKHHTLVVGSLAGILATACSSQAPTPQGTTLMTTDQDRQAVLAAVAQMTQALEQGAVADVMASYERPASIVFEPGDAQDSAETQAQTFAGLAAMKPQFSYAGHEVFVADNLALHIAPWTMKASGPEGPLEQRGLSVAVLRKDTEGRWLLVIDDPHGDHLLRASSAR